VVLTPQQTLSFLMRRFREAGIHLRTKWGQNFLIDMNLIEYILEQADLGPEDVVLEIGAGTGGLTTSLARRAAAVVSVEIDHRVHSLARQAVAHLPNVMLLNCDALRNKNHFSPTVLDALDEQLAAGHHRRLKLVANLPYCIATPVISNLVASSLPWQAILVTIQWELAERMRAQPGTEHYSALSVWLQSQCHIRVLKKLGTTVFWPRPQVDSAIVQLLPGQIMTGEALREPIGDRSFFHDFVRRLFQQRRKFLRSVLVGMYRQELSKAEIDERLLPFAFKDGIRADELDVPTLVKLSRAIESGVVQDTNQAMNR
jgi:16S rRNA (adenine1518-N6/adenine1519-N6)-dimethyltransferase